MEPLTNSLEPKTTWRPAAALELLGTQRLAKEPANLTQAIHAAVRAIDENTFRRVARVDAGIAFEPKALLALLTYCYARGIYGSEDVEDMLRRDSHFRAICRDEFPGALHFRRFRRYNRQALHLCLIAALRFLGRNTKCAETHGDADAMPEEAERRIENAILIDMG